MTDRQRELNPAAAEELQRLFDIVQAPVTAERVWTIIFTPDDRQQLGCNLELAYQSGKTVGMWVKLHGGSGERALIEIALALNKTNETQANWLLRELGEAELGGDRHLGQPVPHWDRAALEIRYQGNVIRRFGRKSRPKNIIHVLDVFQEEHWPSHIDDPLPGGPNKKRLRKTVANLNKGLRVIKFHVDGTGEGITWSLS
jgi:hypothetical protein